MAPNQDVHIPEDQLQLGGLYVPDVVNFMGYAFATTSYSANGLAVREGLADLVDLVRIFRSQHPEVTRVYLVGVSEGGLITALATERYPDVFDGGLALCGPVGDFRAQADYFGDFRMVFDYFFPQILPSSPISIPQSLMDDWHSYYAANVLPAITDPANAISVTQLMSVTQAAYDPLNLELSMGATISGVLWYNVFATNDARDKLHGQPYDNDGRVYSGSLDDARLNGQVQRFSAEAAALNELEAKYQTSRPAAGAPGHACTTRWIRSCPTGMRRSTAARSRPSTGTAMHNNLPPAARYGHCNFTLMGGAAGAPGAADHGGQSGYPAVACGHQRSRSPAKRTFRSPSWRRSARSRPRSRSPIPGRRNRIAVRARPMPRMRGLPKGGRRSASP